MSTHDLEIGDVVMIDPTAGGYINDDPTFWSTNRLNGAKVDPLAYQKTFLVRSFPAPHWVELSEMDGSLWGPSRDRHIQALGPQKRVLNTSQKGRYRCQGVILKLEIMYALTQMS